MAPLLAIAGLPILFILVGFLQKENINVFLMGFFRDLARIKANRRRNKQTSNAMVTMDKAVVTAWDILLGRDDPLAGINFIGEESVATDGAHDVPTSHATFTSQELQEFGSGKNGGPIYLSTFGRVYDVSKCGKF